MAIDNRPKIYTPALAATLKELGVPTPTTAAIFINQLSFWLNTKAGHITKDGEKFIYNTYEDWRQQFPCMSESSIGRMIRALCKLGVIVKESFSDLKRRLVNKPAGFQEYNRTSWMSLCFEKLVELGIDLGYSPESLLGANLQKCSLENSIPKDGSFKNEFSTIYKENSISPRPANPKRETSSTHLNNPNQEVSQSAVSASVPSNWLTQRAPQNPQNNQPITEPSVKNEFVHESHIPATSSDVPKKRNNLNAGNNGQEFDRTEKYVWEIAVREPYPTFLEWWADRHYKPQGGKWETGASMFARRQFYRDPESTKSLFQEFEAYMQTVAQNCNQLQNDGQQAILPSCFIAKPEASEENVKALMGNFQTIIERGAAVLLPTKSTTPTSQSLPFAQATDTTIKPLPDLTRAVDIEEERRRFNELRNQPDAQISLLNEWLATGDQDLKLEAEKMTAVNKFKFERDDKGDVARVLSEVKAIEEVPSSNSATYTMPKADYQAPSSPRGGSPVADLAPSSNSATPKMSNINWDSLVIQCNQWEQDIWDS